MACTWHAFLFKQSLNCGHLFHYDLGGNGRGWVCFNINVCHFKHTWPQESRTISTSFLALLHLATNPLPCWLTIDRSLSISLPVQPQMHAQLWRVNLQTQDITSAISISIMAFSALLGAIWVSRNCADCDDVLLDYDGGVLYMRWPHHGDNTAHGLGAVVRVCMYLWKWLVVLVFDYEYEGWNFYHTCRAMHLVIVIICQLP